MHCINITYLFHFQYCNQHRLQEERRKREIDQLKDEINRRQQKLNRYLDRLRGKFLFSLPYSISNWHQSHLICYVFKITTHIHSFTGRAH